MSPCRRSFAVCFRHRRTGLAATRPCGSWLSLGSRMRLGVRRFERCPRPSVASGARFLGVCWIGWNGWRGNQAIVHAPPRRHSGQHGCGRSHELRHPVRPKSPGLGATLAVVLDPTGHHGRRKRRCRSTPRRRSLPLRGGILRRRSTPRPGYLDGPHDPVHAIEVCRIVDTRVPEELAPGRIRRR